MTFNFLMGAVGLILAGEALGRGARSNSGSVVLLGIAEIIIGVYFIIAAIGEITCG